MKLRIKDLRDDFDYTQEYISNKIKINRRTYAGYENQTNDIPIDILVKLAVVYDVSLHYLCGLTNDKSTKVSLDGYSYEKLLANILHLRESNNLTQEQLSNIIHCSSNTVSQYENGRRKIPLEILIKLSQYYKLTIDEIINLSK